MLRAELLLTTSSEAPLLDPVGPLVYMLQLSGVFVEPREREHITAKTDTYSIKTVSVNRCLRHLDAATVCHCYFKKTFVVWFGKFLKCRVPFVSLCFA